MKKASKAVAVVPDFTKSRSGRRRTATELAQLAALESAAEAQAQDAAEAQVLGEAKATKAATRNATKLSMRPPAVKGNGRWPKGPKGVSATPMSLKPRKLQIKRTNGGSEKNQSKASRASRRGCACMNCGATKTPQWRTGVDFAVLCNACGVRLNKSK